MAYSCHNTKKNIDIAWFQIEILYTYLTIKKHFLVAYLVSPTKVKLLKLIRIFVIYEMST